MTNPSREPGLSVRLDATWAAGILRADQIRHDTLVSLVAHWGSDEARADIIAQLDALAEAVISPREGELDVLVQNVEDAAAMDDAETSLNLARLLRLRDELDAAIGPLARFNPARAARVLLSKVPGQPQRRAS
ncbi:hypothetical protein [Streptomyces xanthophaeus]|uniref:hypothetical protein n=1 Tax=Streptomyces xanthophaeus TaxID=67385 RepID=UPI0026492664|nr:hypothetical protein [Streptomyces xanthophaeus]WKD36559.1 hypothetical protein KO717_34580 [Streptomyces xanthophaeus]